MIVKIISLAAAAVLVAVDQLIKAWATDVLLPQEAIQVLPGIVELRYYLNNGMAFSMLEGRQTLLIGATSLMLAAVLLALLFYKKMTPLERVAWTLVLGGGVGNLIDRVCNGVVVDYINPLFINFAVFNFADICVCTGVGVLVLSILLDGGKAGKKSGGEKAGGTPEQTDADA